MAERVTIKDIAQKVGMSLATVSGVLNGGTRFSESTRNLVWTAANELHYTPSENARNLRSGAAGERRKTGIIMHIVHMSNEMAKHSRDQETDVYRFSWYARQEGLFSIPYCYFQRKGFQCPPLLNGLVDGAVIGTPHPDVVNTVSGKVPVVLMDVPFSTGLVETPMVNTDDRFGYLLALRELKRLGHRRIAAMYFNLHAKAACSGEIIRLRLLESVLPGSGIELCHEYDFKGPIDEETHEEKMREYAEFLAPAVRSGKITAVIATNISYVRSLAAAFRMKGFSVPGDLSITGPYLGFEPPKDVSSIFFNREPMMRTAVGLLKRMIDGEKLPCTETLIRPELSSNFTIGKSKIQP